MPVQTESLQTEFFQIAGLTPAIADKDTLQEALDTAWEDFVKETGKTVHLSDNISLVLHFKKNPYSARVPSAGFGDSDIGHLIFVSISTAATALAIDICKDLSKDIAKSILKQVYQKYIHKYVSRHLNTEELGELLDIDDHDKRPNVTFTQHKD